MPSRGRGRAESWHGMVGSGQGAGLGEGRTKESSDSGEQPYPGTGVY